MMSEAQLISKHVSWGEPDGGLRLGLSAEDRLAELYLQNVGNVPLEVLSHVSAHELHLDWYRLRVKNESGFDRQLHLLDNRNRSVVIRAELKPGEHLQHIADVGEWASRRANGAQPIAPGSYQLFATYDVADEEDCWRGHLEAGPVTLTISQAANSD
jgi:hypothetical protein